MRHRRRRGPKPKNVNKANERNTLNESPVEKLNSESQCDSSTTDVTYVKDHSTEEIVKAHNSCKELESLQDKIPVIVIPKVRVKYKPINGEQLCSCGNEAGKVVNERKRRRQRANESNGITTCETNQKKTKKKKTENCLNHQNTASPLKINDEIIVPETKCRKKTTANVTTRKKNQEKKNNSSLKTKETEDSLNIESKEVVVSKEKSKRQKKVPNATVPITKARKTISKSSTTKKTKHYQTRKSLMSLMKESTTELNNNIEIYKFQETLYNDILTRKEIKILVTQTEKNYNKELTFSYTDLYSCLSQVTVQSGESSDAPNELNNGRTRENQGLQDLSVLSNSIDESTLTGLLGIKLNEFPPIFDDNPHNEIKQNGCMPEKMIKQFEGVPEDNFPPFNDNLNGYISMDEVSEKCRSENSDCSLNNLGKISLQDVVEGFMKNCENNNSYDIANLKKGLCSVWLSNNYTCPNQQCPYSHNALNVFTNKLKTYSSKVVMSLVVSMKADILFVDMIMAAFKISSERRLPDVWITFLVFFVFYVTEPSDCRFLKFWANAARFFCQLNIEYSASRGFTSLLSIFSQGHKQEHWKIMEFIKLIKRPPIQIPTTYSLLQPALKMDIPSQFLTEAVQSCINTGEDVLKVYSTIIPKISFMSSPIHVIELLLKFCSTLEEVGRRDYANNFKARLRAKMQTIKIKVMEQEYPLTAEFQEQLSRNSQEWDSPRENLENTQEELLKTTACPRNYFQVTDDFCQVLINALELVPEPIPGCGKDKKFVNNMEEEKICVRQINRIKQFFRNYQFELLAKYLNDLKPEVVLEAAEIVLRQLFKMKISLDQVLDLIKIFLLPCKAKSSASIMANICITFIFNLIKISDWDKAYALVNLCEEKQINLVEGKVIHLDGPSGVTQFRIVLLLIEICTYKENYQKATELVKSYCVTSPCSSLSQLTWKEDDEDIRIRILEELMWQMIYSRLTDAVYELFELIWRDQKELHGAVGLRKYVNSVMTLLLNRNAEEALKFYEKIKTEVQLNSTNLRAILVTLVRRNSFIPARILLMSTDQNVYLLPDINSNNVIVKLSSCWLEEEIYMVFDTLFDLLAERKFENYEVYMNIQTTETSVHSNTRPLCLGFINPSLEHFCTRIHRVLKYQFNPPIKFFISEWNLKLEERSLQRHLYKRICRDLQ